MEASVDIQLTKSNQNLVGTTVVNGTSYQFSISCATGVPVLTVTNLSNNTSVSYQPSAYQPSPFSATYQLTGAINGTFMVSANTSCFGSSSASSGGSGGASCLDAPSLGSNNISYSNLNPGWYSWTTPDAGFYDLSGSGTIYSSCPTSGGTSLPHTFFSTSSLTTYYFYLPGGGALTTVKSL